MSHPQPARTPDPGLESLLVALEATRDLYTPDVIWTAPRRGIAWHGRDQVMRGLLREAAAMCDAELTVLGRRGGDERVIDEYCVRFLYAGDGIEGVPLRAGDRVELERVRVLGLHGAQIAAETCIETWTVLPGD